MVITFGRVPHKILRVTEGERGELLLTFSRHTHDQIFTIWKHTQIKKLKGYWAQSDAFHYWCLLQHEDILPNSILKCQCCWYLHVKWRDHVWLVGESVAETHLKRREKANDGPGGKKARQAERRWVVRHRSEVWVQSKPKSEKNCHGK